MLFTIYCYLIIDMTRETSTHCNYMVTISHFEHHLLVLENITTLLYL